MNWIRNKAKTCLQYLKSSGHTPPPSFYFIISCCKCSKRFVFTWSQFLDRKRNRDFRRSPYIYTRTHTKREKKSYNAGFRSASRTQQASMLTSRLYIKNQLLPQSEGLWSKKQENNNNKKDSIHFFPRKVWQQNQMRKCSSPPWLFPMALYS